MFKTYSYKNYFYIADAMRIYNSTKPDQKFTLTDFNILCMVRSLNDSGRDFYMLNDQIAKSLLVSEKTVRTSINRLCEHGLLKKEPFMHAQHRKGRYLIYQYEEVEKFVNRMRFGLLKR